MSARSDSSAAEAVECPICQVEVGILSDVVDEIETLTTTSCGHQFGNVCLAQWLSENNTCPMCRTVLGPPVSQPEMPIQPWFDVLGEAEITHLLDNILRAFERHLPDGAPHLDNYMWMQRDSWFQDMQSFLRSWSAANDDLLTSFREGIDNAVTELETADDVQVTVNLLRGLRLPQPSSSAFHRQLFQFRPLAVNLGVQYLAFVESEITDPDWLEQEDVLTVAHSANYVIDWVFDSAYFPGEDGEPQLSIVAEFYAHLDFHDFPSAALTPLPTDADMFTTSVMATAS